MTNRRITDLMSKAYIKVDPSVETMKSAFLGLCTDIDRFFCLSFSIDFEEDADESQLKKISEVFPLFNDLSLDAFHQFQKLFCNIRNVNAHLFLNRPIYIEESVCNYLISKAAPMYAISENNGLTLYGAFYFLTFLSQKYSIWPFVTSFFRREIFDDISKKEMQKIQVDLEHYHQTFCGIGKTIFPGAESNYSKIDMQYLNDTCKRGLTRIFFSFEKSIMQWHFSGENVPSFSILLKEQPQFAYDYELIEQTIKMRNCWFHGSMLFDTCHYREESFLFSLDFVFDVLARLKNLFAGIKYEQVIDNIEKLGKAFLDFYVLRLVEVSYKLLDNRLLTNEKIDSRIKDANNAFLRVINQGGNYYQKIKKMIGADAQEYSVSASKFTDVFPRKTIAIPLVIHKFSCENGFEIGGIHSNSPELSVAEIELAPNFMNPVNGRLLTEYSIDYEEYYSDLLKVVYHSI